MMQAIMAFPNKVSPMRAYILMAARMAERPGKVKKSFWKHKTVKMVEAMTHREIRKLVATVYGSIGQVS